jgi:hypothetical protein
MHRFKIPGTVKDKIEEFLKQIGDYIPQKSWLKVLNTSLIRKSGVHDY